MSHTLNVTPCLKNSNYLRMVTACSFSGLIITLLVILPAFHSINVPSSVDSWELISSSPPIDQSSFSSLSASYAKHPRHLDSEAFSSTENSSSPAPNIPLLKEDCHTEEHTVHPCATLTPAELETMRLDSIRTAAYRLITHVFGVQNQDKKIVQGYVSVHYQKEFDALKITVNQNAGRSSVCKMISPEVYLESMLRVCEKASASVGCYVQSMMDLVSVQYISFIENRALPTPQEELKIITKTCKFFSLLRPFYSNMHLDSEEAVKMLTQFAEYFAYALPKQKVLLEQLKKNVEFLYPLYWVEIYLTLGTRLFEREEDSLKWLDWLAQRVDLLADNEDHRKCILHSLINVALVELIRADLQTIVRGVDCALLQEEHDSSTFLMQYFTQWKRNAFRRVHLPVEKFIVRVTLAYAKYLDSRTL